MATIDGKTVVYAGGVWDLLHVGHLAFLEEAKKLGGWLIVGVLPDDVVKAWKRDPVIPYMERVRMLRALRIVDEVVKQEERGALGTLKKFPHVDICVHGDDVGEDYRGIEYMRSRGKRGHLIPYYLWQSTTEIIERVRRLYGDG